MQQQWVACAMSGGVDSSVTAALLVEQGFRVIGLTMHLWSEVAEGERACCSLSAVQDAKRVCAQLDIPHYTIDLRETFREAVIADFIAEYRAGRTPNPCIRCNRILKFDYLLARARALGATALATGHYARIARHDDLGRWSVRRGLDPRKDQSYALYGLTQAQLARTILPLGDMEKTRTREIAAALGLRVATKPDSQEICFIPDNDYGRFLRDVAPEVVQPGEVRNTIGRAIGRHHGIAFYTIGQRRRLDLPGHQPRFVVALDAAANVVTVGTEEDLRHQTVIAEDVVCGKWDADTLRVPRRVTAMLRYKMTAQPATARVEDERLIVTFDAPQRAITPGQALVCYEGDDVVAGGTITAA